MTIHLLTLRERIRFMGLHLSVDEARQLFGGKIDTLPGKKHVKAEMNRWEAQYASVLETSKTFGDIKAWRFEKVNLKLADKTYFKPDFLVIHNAHSGEFVEIKGQWREDARVKVKVAAEQFPFFKFTVAFGLKQGAWQYERWNQSSN